MPIHTCDIKTARRIQRKIMMWSPDKNAELLAALLPSASNQPVWADSYQPVWASMDSVRSHIIKLVLARNNGTLNYVSSQDIVALCGRVVARMDTQTIPVIPHGASCFCGRPCDCSSRSTVQYDVRNIDAIASASVHSTLIASLQERHSG